MGVVSIFLYRLQFPSHDVIIDVITSDADCTPGREPRSVAASYGRPMEQGRPLYFHPVSFFFFISSPNLSGRRLDVYHTSTHGVALLRIQNAALKCAARGSMKKKQNSKITNNSPSAHRRTTLSGCIFATKACIDNRKKARQQYLLHMSAQYGELRPTNG